jgi:HD-GYP domain-containing protein (c-di-GMP phosphodiesterase class II)
MGSETIGRIVQALSVALMNAVVYFPEHRRVADAAQETVAALGAYFQGRDRFVLGVIKGLLIAEGAPLYDLSVRARRLMDAITERGGFGLRFESGIAPEEIVALVNALLQSRTSSAKEVNALLAQQGVVHVALETRALREASTQTGAGAAVAEPGEEQKPATESGAGGGGGAAAAFAHDETSIELYTWALGGIRDFIGNLKHDRKAAFTQTHDIAVGLTEALARDRNSFVSMASVKDYDSYTFNHSVNVCIYTTAIAEQLTTDAQERIAIAQAALLHDVGKILIPDTVLFKPGALTDAEWAIMRQHPALGAKVLMEAHGTSEIAINVAFGHHLRHDQKGYPTLAVPITIDFITQLVNVIDVYEALTAKRPYKKAFSPERAADVLLKGVGSEFNPVCVDLFLRYFGIYPPGTPVRLTDGSEGAVAAANPCDAVRPMVQVTHAPNGEVLARPLIIDTSEKTPSGEYRVQVACSKAALAASAPTPAPA